MRRAMVGGVAFAFSSWLAACGGAETVSDGEGGAGAHGGTGTGSTSSGGGTLVVPAECASSNPGPVPSEITFRFVNEGASPLWIGSPCSRPIFEVRSCLDDWSAAIAPAGCNDCTQSECEECPYPPAVCESNVTMVTADAPHVATWSTTFYEKGVIESGDGCPCHFVHAAPSAKYRVRLDVFAEEPTRERPGDDAYLVELDFELPSDGPIEVRVDG